MILRNVVGSDHFPPGIYLLMRLFHHFLVFLSNWAINQDSVSTQLLSDFHWIQSLLSKRAMISMCRGDVSGPCIMSPFLS